MVIFRILLAVLFLCLSPVPGQESYFVKLTPDGLGKRSQLIGSVPGTDRTITKIQNAGILKPVLKTSLGQFDHWLQLALPPGADSIKTLLIEEGIASLIEPVGILRVQPSTDDSLVNEQWYLDMIAVEEAWAVTTGRSDIIVAVIDTGIDYLHPDLENRIWINAGEDLNGNGMWDAEDENGIDDDGNGYTDDIAGWDFTDAPRFADGGDFRDPDNDPMDDYSSGHGTQIAGIIAAEQNNTTGISGVAPDIRVMNLRAGTASGYLEEDDVARAILYAMENNARIINMSFGDVALSRFLRDVIAYAYDHDIVLIASAGNEATDRVHYPSGLVEVISIGASAEDDDRAGFSNFGSSVDLLAPGKEMFSTAIGGAYNSVNGTSFSAPVASAVAALILSEDPALSNEQVRNLLKTGSVDILIPGWDYWSASGRLSAGRAMQAVRGGVLTIHYPVANGSVGSEKLAITGSALHPDMSAVELAYGFGENPEEWITIERLEQRQVLEDTLALMDLSAFADTTITLLVRMELIDQTQDEVRTVFRIDRTPPVISNVGIRPMLDGDQSSTLVSFNTDDITRAGLFLDTGGEGVYSDFISSGYETGNHRIKIDQRDYEGEFSFFITAENSSGLVTSQNPAVEDYAFSNSDPFTWNDFFELAWTLPAGYMLNHTTDFDGDQNPEIVLSRYTDSGAFGPVEIHEFEDGRFIKRYQSGFTAIPRAAGDVDGDGLGDLLVGYGDNAFILEAMESTSFPETIVWSDTVQFWAAAYGDLDQDGQQEIIGRRDSLYLILEHRGGDSFVEIAALSNPTAGENRYGVPKVAIGDLNTDGKPELVFGDSDGDVLIYSSLTDNTFNLVHTVRISETDATEMIVSNNQGQMFVAGHTRDDRNYEHEFDARYWQLEQIVLQNGDAQISEINTFTLYGYQSTRDYDSGINMVKVNKKDALLVSFFPNLYVFFREDNVWKPVWHYQGAHSNTVIADDFDGDGNDELFFNDGKEIRGYGVVPSESPVAPRQVQAVPLDSNRIRITWAGTATQFQIYRGFSLAQLEFQAQTIENEYLDDGLQTDETYYYAIRSLDSSFSIPQSPYSPPDSAKTSLPPRLMEIEIQNPYQLITRFNEAVLVDQPEIILNHSGNRASSVIRLGDPAKLLISFSRPFVANITDTLIVTGITDEHQVPIDQMYNTGMVNYTGKPSTPYLQTLEVLDRKRIKLIFSEPMDSVSVRNTEHYQLQPTGFISQVRLLDQPVTAVELELSSNSYAGGFGKPAYLSLNNLKSEAGIKLIQSGKLHIFQPASDLSGIIMYPQPVKPGHTEMYFANVPKDVDISIYNLNGKLIKTFKDGTFFGGVRWDLKDREGKRIPTGIYLYEIRHKGERKLGKIAVVR